MMKTARQKRFSLHWEHGRKLLRYLNYIDITWSRVIVIRDNSIGRSVIDISFYNYSMLLTEWNWWKYIQFAICANNTALIYTVSLPFDETTLS